MGETLSAIEDWASNVLDWFGVRPLKPKMGEEASGPIKKEIDDLSTKVGMAQSNKLDEIEAKELAGPAGKQGTLEKKLAKLKEAEEKTDPTAPEFTKLAKDVAATKDKANVDPSSSGSDPDKWRKLLGELVNLEARMDAKLKEFKVPPAGGAPSGTDAELNNRLASLNMTPKQQPGEGKAQFIKRLDAFNDKIAKENGTATPEDRLARLKEADSLFNNPNPVVQDHTAKLLYRAVSVGLGDCEPLLVQYAAELGKQVQDGVKPDGTPKYKPDGDLGKLQAMAKVICERMVAKDLFGRYVAETLTGSAAVEKLQGGDANDFYFWSQTSYMVDQSIRDANLDGKKLAVRLEKSAAAAMFDDLDFGNGWSSDHFRAIFEGISGAYADKAIQRAKDAASDPSSSPAIVLTAYRGVNMGSVLGKTEWPRIKKAIEDNKLAFTFDIYCWSGEPVSSGFSAAKWGFADAKFTSAKFNGMAVHQSLTDIKAVDATTWTFEDYDELTKCGGLHKSGKGPGSAFSTMPVAFFDKQLVGKDSSGIVWLIKPDGTVDRTTSKLEADFVKDPT